MKRIEWGERFSVGVAVLDEQHKELIRMLNCLIDHPRAGADSEPMVDVLEKMTQYAAYHFRTEEQLFSEYEYPQYAAHNAEHTEFKTKAARFCMEAIARKNGLAGEVLHYLRAWLMNHILVSDMKYKPFFAAKIR